MHPNYQYLLDIGLELAQVRPGVTVLDYGCGNGEIVEEGLKRGLSIYGTDVFYDPNPDARALLDRKGLLGGRIREIRDGRIPFDDAAFDLVVTNMVFEHVKDLESVLRELDRVLKPGGMLVALFPTMGVWREAHTGIPFLHWFPKGSRVRWCYAWLLRMLGFGTFKSRPRTKWVAGMLDYLDNFVHYRPQKLIVEMVERHFSLTWLEPHHLAFRLRRAGLRRSAGIVALPGIGYLAVLAFRRLAYVAFLVRKRGGAGSSGPAWIPGGQAVGAAGPEARS